MMLCTGSLNRAQQQKLYIWNPDSGFMLENGLTTRLPFFLAVVVTVKIWVTAEPTLDAAKPDGSQPWCLYSGQGRQLAAPAPLRWRARSIQGRCARGPAPCPSTSPDPRSLGPACSAQTVLLALAYTGTTCDDPSRSFLTLYPSKRVLANIGMSDPFPSVNIKKCIPKLLKSILPW